MANSVDPEQTAPLGAVCSGSTLFASILNQSVMLGNYLQQTTFSDAFFSWRFKGYDEIHTGYIHVHRRLTLCLLVSSADKLNANSLDTDQAQSFRRA